MRGGGKRARASACQYGMLQASAPGGHGPVYACAAAIWVCPLAVTKTAGWSYQEPRQLPIAAP